MYARALTTHLSAPSHYTKPSPAQLAPERPRYGPYPATGQVKKSIPPAPVRPPPPRLHRTPEQQMVLSINKGDVLSIPEIDKKLLPSGLKKTLLLHQLQGLAWIRYMENPKFPSTQRDGVVQLWRQKVRSTKDELFNDLTQRFSAPREALGRGGIVADDMGLGKTLLLLVHILVSKDTEPVGADSPYCSTTLIIVPLSVLQTWEKEVDDSMEPGRLRFLTYHGDKAGSNMTVEHLKSYDVVITTYHTLRAHHSKKGLLFQVQWKRMILDEGHEAVNPTAKLTQAVMDVKAERRIISTGTPLINRVQDFGTQLSILQVCKPLHRAADFTKFVVKRLKDKDEDDRLQAEDRLRSIVRQTTLRRTKDMLRPDGSPLVPLPPVTVMDIPVVFSPATRAQYDQIVDLVQDRVGQLIALGKPRDISTFVLQAVTYLRLHCLASSLVKVEWLERLRQDVAKFRSDPSKLPEPQPDKMIQKALLASDFFDRDLDQEVRLSASITAARSLKLNFQKITDKLLIGEDSPEASTPSPKVQALQQELEGLPVGDKILVFSQFTTFLNKVQRDLRASGIHALRLDGSLSDVERRSVLDTFNKSDPADAAKWPKKHPRVLLLSLKAGACGLNLTVANHVYFTDPWWQPAIIQQATDRIRRIGQTKPMTVRHLWAKGTVEDRVRAIQARKAELAKDAFSWITTPVIEEDEKLARIEEAMKALGL
ncbi:hypothetical protein EXIGLDRAFT_749508 [Exidia glandulosa HHB12029]|uniref:P-loop containing nucleoside triphosphate hydrolase protein n=1 Tax=Exidia glandulosa HHB12029 TaxID=1314781 RepID=A0A165HZZ8_EXIGL|nr:hypothetical protein EXIGLDRAFT_749508 [Exidia glandulosa HHB12029]